MTPPSNYQAARDALRQAELELMRQREAVAALRRELPPDSRTVGYQFVAGPRDLAEGDEPEAIPEPATVRGGRS